MHTDPELEARFWAKVIRKGKDDCWPWYKVPKAYYPSFAARREDGKHRARPAHRWAYKFTYGEPPKGSYLCHRCGNRYCCNPAHIYAGTQKMNMEDAIRLGTFKFPPRVRGDAVHNAKLTDEKVRLIRAAYPLVFSKKALAIAFGIHPEHCRRIARGESWLIPPCPKDVA